MTSIRRLLRHKVMSPDEERALATEIRNRRVASWRLLLGYRPIWTHLADVLAQFILEDDSKHAAKHANDVREAVEAWAESPPAERRRRTVGLVELIQLQDGDGTLLRRAVAEMRAYGAGKPSRIAKPRPRGQSFPRLLSALGHELALLERAKHTFVERNMKLVASIACRYRRSGMSDDDLIQDGTIGLMKAVERFDHRKGFRFSTYASWWIRQSVGRGVSKTSRLVRLPVHIAEDLSKLMAAERKAGRILSPEEMSAATKLPIWRVRKVLKAQTRVVSADAGERPIINGITDPTANVESLAEEHATIDLVEDILIELTASERDIIARRFGLGDYDEHTLGDVGKLRSLSRERIRQLQDRAMARMRASQTVREISDSREPGS